MIVKPLEEIVKEVLEAYNRNPRHWHVLYGLGKKSRRIIYIGRKGEGSVWAILTEPHFGVGARIDDVDIERFFREEREEFGLRQVSETLEERIMRDIYEYGRISPRTLELLRKELNNPPKRIEEVEGLPVMIGPYAITPGIESIDERISSELEAKFEEKLEKRLLYIG